MRNICIKLVLDIKISPGAMFLSSLSPVFAGEYFSLFFRLFYLFYTTNVVKRRWKKSSPVLVFFFVFFCFQVFVFRCPSFSQSGVYSSSEIGSIFRLESVVDHRYQVPLSLRAILSTPVRKKKFSFIFCP